MKSKLLLQVHDELVFDAHKDELEDLKLLVEEKMVGAVKLEVPMDVDMGVGQNWLEAH
jgi:DNA polymerase-1